MKTVGFIGIGIMGQAMAKNLLKAGYDVQVYTRTKAKADAVVAAGAKWCDTIAACGDGAQAVITMVGFPKDVEEVYFGEEGILKSCAPGTYVIDMTTTSPRLSEKIFEAAQKQEIYAIDAPVTGGDGGARAGTLTILAGGRKEDFDACLPLFEAMGKNIHYLGGAGSGQHAKMANQIAIAGAVAGAAEAMVYAKNAGLNVPDVLAAISTGAAGSVQMSNVISRAVEGDYAPGFFIKHFIKDMKLADEESMERHVRLEVLEQVLSMYEKLAAEGDDHLGTQAILKYYGSEER